MQGYLEFVPDCMTLAQMQYAGKIKFLTDKANVFNTFSNDSITRTMYEVVGKRVREKMEKESEFDVEIDEKEYQ